MTTNELMLIPFIPSPELCLADKHNTALDWCSYILNVIDITCAFMHSGHCDPDSFLSLIFCVRPRPRVLNLLDRRIARSGNTASAQCSMDDLLDPECSDVMREN